MAQTAIRLRFRTSCVDSDGPSITAMVDNARDITRKTFLAHVDRDDRLDLERTMGYSQFRDGGLMMANDWHVTYHKSVYRGRRCYYFRQSAIEYVFA